MEYIEKLIYAAMLFEGMLMIMPSGNMKKYIRVVAGVTLSMLLLTPLSSCAGELRSAIG